MSPLAEAIKTYVEEKVQYELARQKDDYFVSSNRLDEASDALESACAKADVSDLCIESAEQLISLMSGNSTTVSSVRVALSIYRDSNNG